MLAELRGADRGQGVGRDDATTMTTYLPQTPPKHGKLNEQINKIKIFHSRPKIMKTKSFVRLARLSFIDSGSQKHFNNVLF